MNRNIETVRGLPEVPFDEPKFRELHQMVNSPYNLNGVDLLGRCYAETGSIGLALHSDQYFTDAIELVNVFTKKSRFLGRLFDGNRWGDLAWSLFLENGVAIEQGVQNGDNRQAWAVLETIKNLVPCFSDIKQMDVAVDFLRHNFEPTLRAAENKAGDRGVLQTILYYGNDEQTQFVRKFLLDALDDQDPVIRFSVPHWIYSLSEGLGSETVAERIRGEKNILINQLLEKYQLTHSGIIEDWNNTGNPDGEAYGEGNLRAICRLEAQAPGITETLHRDFGISHFARYPTEVLLRQFEQGDQGEIPYGVIIYPKADYNGVLSTHQGVFAKLLQQAEQVGYALRVAESDSKQNLVSVLNRFRNRYGKIAFAVIGGHGEPDNIRIGRDNNRGIIYTADISRRAASATQHAFEKNPTIILASCSTGAPDGIGQEIANLGATVIAPKKPTDLRGISIKRVGEQLQFEVRFRDKDDDQVLVCQK